MKFLECPQLARCGGEGRGEGAPCHVELMLPRPASTLHSPSAAWTWAPAWPKELSPPGHVRSSRAAVAERGHASSRARSPRPFSGKLAGTDKKLSAIIEQEVRGSRPALQPVGSPMPGCVLPPRPARLLLHLARGASDGCPGPACWSGLRCVAGATAPSFRGAFSVCRPL